MMIGLLVARRGSTLIELLMALLLIGLASAVVTLWIPGALEPEPVDVQRQAHAARALAIRTGRRHLVTVSDSARSVRVLAFPDGSMIADSGLAIVRLTGLPPETANER